VLAAVGNATLSTPSPAASRKTAFALYAMDYHSLGRQPLGHPEATIAWQIAQVFTTSAQPCFLLAGIPGVPAAGLRGEFEDEAGAASGAVLDPDRPVVPRHVPGHDRETKTDPAILSRSPTGTTTAEPLEDPVPVGDGYAGPRIVEPDDDTKAAGLDGHAFATTTVAFGVLDQVRDHSLEPAFVGLQGEGCRIGAHLRDRATSGGVGGDPDQVGDAYGIPAALVCPVIAGDLQQVDHQPPEPLEVLAEQLDRFAHGSGQLVSMVVDQFHRVQHGRQRGPQLVADVGGEPSVSSHHVLEAAD
jgi:hypothetical protein